jgi:large repetitive protein
MNSVTNLDSIRRTAHRGPGKGRRSRFTGAGWLQCVLVLVMWLSHLQAAQAVQAGTRIATQARASFLMPGMVQPVTAWSEVVLVNVAAVESLTLTGPTSLHVPPGVQVALAYQLTNTGNTESRYALQPGNSGCSDPATAALSNLRLALDTNRNGVVEAQETVTAPGTVTLLPGQSASLLVLGGVPIVASGTACVSLSAVTAGERTATARTRVQIGTGASVSLSKTVSSTGALVRGASTLDFTLVANSIGTQTAALASTDPTATTPLKVDGTSRSLVLLRDEIPVGTQYVANSLKPSQVDALRLYRLAGDPMLEYRSGDHADAVEVAVGLLRSLDAGSATSMRFQAKLKPVAPGLPSDVVNVGEILYADGGQPTAVRSNAIVLPISDNRLGVALQAVSVVPQADALGTADGTAIVTFRARLRNYGNAPLYNPRLLHRLQHAVVGNSLGTWTQAAVPSPGQYTVVPGSLRTMAASPSSTKASLSTTYTGHADGQDNLLGSEGFLPPGGDLTLQYQVRVNFMGRVGDVRTQAMAEAARAPEVLPDVADTGSANGTDPDPLGNGLPQTQASETPVSTPPLLSVSHIASMPRRLGNGEFEIDHTIKVTNSGATPAVGVRVFNNLECAIKSSSGNNVTGWRMTAGPTAHNGKLAVNADYKGVVPNQPPCGNSIDTNSGAPLDGVLSLTDGNGTLAAGASETITFTVRVNLTPIHGANARLSHRVWAVAYDGEAANATHTVAATNSVIEVVLLIDPQGIVYDSVTRAPIAGATVRLQRTSCQGGVPATPIIPAEIAGGGSPAFTYHADGSVSMVTSASGEYQFFWASPPVQDLCTYAISAVPPTSGNAYFSSNIAPQPGTFAACGDVVPNATAPQGNEPTTWYASAVSGRNGPAGAICEVLHNHIPLDPASSRNNILFLEKGANKKELELGDFIDYKLNLTNRSSATLTGVSFTDTLPPGFAYVAGTTFFNGVRVADPSGGAGPSIVFDQPTHALASGASVSVQFRVKVGVGAPTAAPAINRAVARSSGATSNEATHSVKVAGGVFADDAFAIGKVWLDCNRNGEQDGDKEWGVPGVRLFLENGTSVTTDGEGRWSLFGLKPITHVVKLDRRTLPAGAELQPWDNRNAGSADSRFVDLKKGELAKANFPITNCGAPGLLDAVQKRRESAKVGAELDTAVKLRLTPSMAITAATGPGPAASQGGLGSVAPASAPLIDLPSALGGIATPGAPVTPGRAASPVPVGALDPLPAATPVALETALPGLNNQPAFIDLKDGDTVPTRQLNVRVKGPLGTTLRLSVGGVDVSERRVGKKADLGSTATTAWEYIGVALQPGTNRLQLTVIDPMGNPRDTAALNITAPDDLAQLHIDAAAERVYADPLTPFPMVVRLTDSAGVPVTARTAVTLEADRGSFADADLNPLEPGTQVFIEGGVGRIPFTPPAEPGAVRVRATSGLLVRENLLTLLPHLQPMSGIGIVEAVFAAGERAKLPAGADSQGSAFEAELSSFVREGKHGRASGRTAFYFKGAVKGDYLLTAAYDSDKTTKDRLFRDIRPDEYYPIYGDDSTRGYDAQSVGKLYVRIDKERSYLLYGDFTSSASPEVRKLSQVNRSLNGVKHHYETERVRVTSHAAQTASKQQVEEVPANGLSFYFLSGTGDIVPNSEQVELLVRSRTQPQLVLSTRKLVRNTDYTLEPLTRRLMLVAPLPSVDTGLNPQSLRVSYEVNQGGPEYLNAGVDAQFKLGERVQVGVAAAKDDNPENHRRGLQAVTVLGRVGDNTVVAAEVVRTESDAVGSGGAQRVEVRHADGDFKLNAEVSRTDATFENPGATTSAGRTEGTARAEYPINDTTRVRAEATYSRNDNLPDATPGRNVSVAVHKKLNDHLAIEAGVRDGNTASTRAGSFDYGVAPPGMTGMGGAASNLSPATATPDAVDTTTARVRVTARPPMLPSAEVFGELEQDLHDSDRRLLAVGGSYALGANARVYGRREFNSSLYDNGTDTNRVTSIVGIDGAYMEGGRVYNEYRMGTRGASNGTGLRNTYAITEHLQLSGSAEHSKQLSGTGDDATAATLGLDYSSGPWRGSSSMEWREAGDASSWLFNLAGAYRLDNDWSVLARSVLTQTGDDKAGTRRLSRMQVGLAWRPAHTDVVNGLLRYERRQETITAGSAGGSAYSLYGTSGAALPGDYDTHLVAGVINVNPRRGEVITGRYAARINGVADDISTSRTFTQLLHARYTRDLTPDWDLGVQLGLLRSRGGARQSLFGLELGYQVTPGLWLSGGYNWRGLRDDELAGTNYTHQGWYLRLRFKFDETNLGLGGGASATPSSSKAAAPAARQDAPAAAPPPAPEPAAAKPAPVAAAEPDGLTDPLASRLQWSEAFLFKGDGTELLPAGKARLERLGTLLKQAKARRLELSLGHGDEPARVDAVWLPRAKAVRSLLLKTCGCAVGMSLDTQPVPFATASTTSVEPDAGGGYALFVQAIAAVVATQR